MPSLAFSRLIPATADFSVFLDPPVKPGDDMGVLALLRLIIQIINKQLRFVNYLITQALDYIDFV